AGRGRPGAVPVDPRVLDQLGGSRRSRVRAGTGPADGGALAGGRRVDDRAARSRHLRLRAILETAVAAARPGAGPAPDRPRRGGAGTGGRGPRADDRPARACVWLTHRAARARACSCSWTRCTTAPAAPSA